MSKLEVTLRRPALISDAAARARSDRRKGPQPWLMLKLTIALAAAVIAYSGYVYIGKLCIPMIKRERSSLGSRTMGIVFLVVFAVLGMMVIWSYIKAVFTPPGYAIKYFVAHTIPTAAATTASADSADPDLAGLFYAQHTALLVSTHHTFTPHVSANTAASTVARIYATEYRKQRTSFVALRLAPSGVGKAKRGKLLQTPTQSRAPPRLPSLREEHRYCRRCAIVKPPRTHHCRACGTCVLKYDHHCPWIGQCVGAQNQKFFFVFVVWDMLFCLWTFSTLVGLNVRGASRTDTTLDPQHIVVMVLCETFSCTRRPFHLTTIALTTDRGYSPTNQTTVEHVAAQAMKDRENEKLNTMHSFWSCVEKRRTRQAWNAEWGRIGREGNMWWLGDMRAHWEQVFGPRTWTWLLPIGANKELGLDYPRNPRFDKDGRWMPRKEWPAELQ
ncbi:DHHC palmitoyltransferase-domain-containing protein [Lactarius quietus]|nr:DHHC palmitoyltransferase-domain-containing protein [Lactarius quietus]